MVSMCKFQRPPHFGFEKLERGSDDPVVFQLADLQLEQMNLQAGMC